MRCVVTVGESAGFCGARRPPDSHDHLDDLLAFGQQFDNIIIKE